MLERENRIKMEGGALDVLQRDVSRVVVANKGRRRLY